MPPHAPAETIASHGCRTVSRRVEGSIGRELFLLCEPVDAGSSLSQQATAVYTAIAERLEADGLSFAQVARESVFMASATGDGETLRDARGRTVGAGCPAPLMIEQPPLAPDARLAVAMHLRASGTSAVSEPVSIESACGCAVCASPQAVHRVASGVERVEAAAVFGRGSDVCVETVAAFERAEELLFEAGMEFCDVVRTWIHLRDIDRDYDALNRGRRLFFDSRGIDPPPASTGIGGGPASTEHDLCLGFEAILGDGAVERRVMHAATLNEAPDYGADFVRGLRVADGNAVTLHVSGTASVDETGATAHVGDFDAQAERMLLNVRTLLQGQGADFGDIVSAITYVKHRADAGRLRAALVVAGFDGFPHALVEAPVCRPELLCETEAIAILPADAA